VNYHEAAITLYALMDSSVFSWPKKLGIKNGVL